MPIVGIDPGLQTTGYGVLETSSGKIQFLEAGVLRTDSTKNPNLATRIQTLFVGLCELLDEWKPTVLAIEQLYSHYEHPRTAILMAHARGAFLLAAAQREIDVVDYSATRIKKLITGSGRASKEQVQFAVTRELNLDKVPEPHDAADALAIALAHAYSGTAIHGKANARYTGVNRAMLLADENS
jgi:crossover junction endodeoxyribonuclease RuvC